jgi:HEAT repeat protein
MDSPKTRLFLGAGALALGLFAGIRCAGPDDAQQMKAAAALIDRLETRDWDKAVEELVRIGKPAVDPLIAALDRTERFTPGRASIALARIGTTRAVKAVYQAAERPEARPTNDLMEALGAIRTAKAEKLLIKVVLDEQAGGLRYAAARALGERPSTNAVAAVTTLLKAGAWYNRVGGVQTLGKTKSPGAIPALVAALSDESRVVQAEARKALAGFGPPAIDALVKTLPTAGPKDRWQILWILGRIGTARAIDPLLAALESADWMARSEAAVSLSRMEDGSVDPRLRAVVEGADRSLGEEAAWILAARSAGGPRAERWTEVKAPSEPPSAWSAPPAAPGTLAFGGRAYPVYPETVPSRPSLPSPLKTPDGAEYVLTLTSSAEWAVFPVTPGAIEPGRPQLAVDAADFPALAANGLHAEDELARTRMIPGRSIAEITELGRPGALSTDGFMPENEDVLSILLADNRLVARLGLKHPDLARPLYHVWNMMLTDLGLDRWNMSAHRWGNIRYFLYNGKTVLVDASDSKGGQESIFEDGLGGAFGIDIRRDLTAVEDAFLRKRYARLGVDRLTALKEKLTHIQTGEMEPHYIQWYGFYEGHTDWRTDPVVIAFLFGLRSLDEIESAFPEGLDTVLFASFARD